MMKRMLKKAAAFPPIYHTARYLNRHKAVILMYHGLTENPAVRDWTQIRPADFERQIRYLADNYHVLPMTEIAGLLESDPNRPYPAAVTFDDGYLSNLTLALPILQKYHIPATVFVTSGFINGYDKRCGLLWPDFLSALLRSIPDNHIDLTDIGLDRFDLSSGDHIDAARQTVADHLKALPAAEREKHLDLLDGRFGNLIAFENFPEYHPLSPIELKALAADPLISVGGHSIGHPILSRLEGDDLESEIVGCQRDLEKMTGANVIGFAYPNGRLEDIGPEALTVTARHYQCAVTTETGLNGRQQNKFLLRRIGVGRIFDFKQFKVLLSGVYNMGQKPIQAIN